MAVPLKIAFTLPARYTVFSVIISQFLRLGNLYASCWDQPQIEEAFVLPGKRTRKKPRTGGRCSSRRADTRLLDIDGDALDDLPAHALLATIIKPGCAWIAVTGEILD